MNNKMILIQSIKYIEVENNVWPIHSFTAPKYYNNHDEPVDEAVVNELVCGRRFVNVNGVEICIGMAEEHQNLLGLPFEVFNNMETEISELNFIIGNQNKTLSDFRSMSLWNRIKGIFFGFKQFNIGN